MTNTRPSDITNDSPAALDVVLPTDIVETVDLLDRCEVPETLQVQLLVVRIDSDTMALNVCLYFKPETVPSHVSSGSTGFASLGSELSNRVAMIGSANESARHLNPLSPRFTPRFHVHQARANQVTKDD